MKKVGIVTVQRAVNFGAALQMYGLYMTIKKSGGEVRIVDYDSIIIKKREEYFLNLFRVSGNGGVLKKIFFKINSLVSLPFNYRKKWKFEKFLDERFQLTKKYTDKDIKSSNQEVDIFIAGSDQIWNRELNDDDNYFLSFAEKGKKYSYAASFGKVAGYEKKKEHNQKLLKDFEIVSVRENIGIEELETVLERKIYKHIDPTLLLNRHEWGELSKMPNKVSENEEYIVLYWATYRMKRFAENLAKKNHWKIYDLNEGIVKGKMKNLRGLGPEEFLGIFQNAKYVCTTSFHGMVFSIIFHIPFKVDFNPDSVEANERQIELLKLSGIEGCNFDQNQEIVEIEWESCDRNIQVQKERAIEYLKNVLEGA